MCPKVTSEYKAEIKERIIQSAIECFSKYGLDKTTMEEVAQKADLSKGTLYLYFKSKEDLFYVICDNNLKVLKEQLSQILATTKTKEDLVSKKIDAGILPAPSGPDVYVHHTGIKPSGAIVTSTSNMTGAAGNITHGSSITTSHPAGLAPGITCKRNTPNGGNGGCM
jgi:AcrR family transcriptional regulator